MKKTKIGDLIGNKALHNRYWFGVAYELERLGYTKQIETKRGKPKKHKALKELPDEDTLRMKVREKFFTRHLHDVIAEAAGEVQTVKEDMESWNDSLQDNEGLSQTSKAEEVQSAVDELEYADLDELESVSTELQELLDNYTVVLPYQMLTWFPWRAKKRRTGRNWILGDAAEAMNCVAERINELLAEKDTVQIQHEDKTPATESELEEMSDLSAKLTEVAEALQSVECPGMF